MFELLLLALGFGCGLLLGRQRVHRLQTQGEAVVSRALTTRFGGADYHLLNSVTLPTEEGSTQIDHLLVSRYGVFVIEAKHYAGWLFADARSASWTQVIYKTKRRFQNPLRQNYKHLKAVQAVLDFLPAEAVMAAVVFTGSAEFRTQRPVGVYSLDGLLRFIAGFDQEVITANRLQFTVGRLECLRLALSKQTDVQHRAHLSRRFGESG